MRNIDLFSLVAMAWGIQLHQLSAPAWLNATRFDISARVPEGINADQHRRMQNMLTERFHLTTHRESREMRVSPRSSPDSWTPRSKTPPAFEGNYHVLLTALVGATPSGPTADTRFQSLFDALPVQLGLRLVPRKAQVDILVVDRMDKSPTEN